MIDFVLHAVLYIAVVMFIILTIRMLLDAVMEVRHIPFQY